MAQKQKRIYFSPFIWISWLPIGTLFGVRRYIHEFGLNASDTPAALTMIPLLFSALMFFGGLLECNREHHGGGIRIRTILGTLLAGSVLFWFFVIFFFR
ncbi:MAG: hypothetical protein K9L30_03110 [Desulfobacterales bacterium]|nr:hypothetical protein [Desulfobacterales bacterium]